MSDPTSGRAGTFPSTPCADGTSGSVSCTCCRRSRSSCSATTSRSRSRAKVQTGPPGTPLEVDKVFYDVPYGPVMAVFLLLATIDHLRRRPSCTAGTSATWHAGSTRRAGGVLAQRLADDRADRDADRHLRRDALIAIFGVNAAMILFGWLMERVNPPDEPVTWRPFVFGSIVGAVPWIAIAIAIDRARRPRATTACRASCTRSSSRCSCCSSASRSTRRCSTAARAAARYLYGERVYLVLSLVAKSVLAWQVFAGALARPDTSAAITALARSMKSPLAGPLRSGFPWRRGGGCDDETRSANPSWASLGTVSRMIGAVLSDAKARVVEATTSLFSHGPQPLEHTLDHLGDPGLLGPGSVRWRGDRRRDRIRRRHPRTADADGTPRGVAGVEQHSRYRVRPARSAEPYVGVRDRDDVRRDAGGGRRGARVRSADRPVTGGANATRPTAPTGRRWRRGCTTCSPTRSSSPTSPTGRAG